MLNSKQNSKELSQNRRKNKDQAIANQDFIQQNIERLRNIVKLSPRYDNDSQNDSVMTSTRNLN